MLSEKLLLIYAIGFLGTTAKFLVTGTLVPFLNEVSFTSHEDASFFFVATAIHVLVRIPLKAVFGELSARAGPVRTLRNAIFVALAGAVLILFGRLAKPVFLSGYFLTAILYVSRVLRVSTISEFVSARNRTTVLSGEQIAVRTAFFFGPFLWIAAQTMRGQIIVIPRLIVIDRFSITYLLVFFCMVLSCVCALRLCHLTPPTDALVMESEENSAYNVTSPLLEAPLDERNYNTLSLSERGDHIPPASEGNSKALMRSGFFMALMALGRIPSTAAESSFQPIMVNMFTVSDAHLGQLYLLVATTALAVTVMNTALSRRVADRHLLLAGLACKAVGMMLYLPLWGRVTEAQVVLGYVLCFRVNLFQTVTESVFTKVTRNRAGRLKGIARLGALADLVGALTRLFLARWLNVLFGGWAISIFLAPIIGAVLLISSGWDVLSAIGVDSI